MGYTIYKTVVATAPCGEKDQHLHVVHTNDGQVYALHGTEEAIKNLGKLHSKRQC